MKRPYFFGKTGRLGLASERIVWILSENIPLIKSFAKVIVLQPLFIATVAKAEPPKKMIQKVIKKPINKNSKLTPKYNRTSAGNPAVIVSRLLT